MKGDNLLRRPAQEIVEAVGRGMNKARPAYLFAEASPSLNVTPGWSLPSSTQGKDDRRVDMTKVVPRYRTNLPEGVETCPRRFRTHSGSR